MCIYGSVYEYRIVNVFFMGAFRCFLVSMCLHVFLIFSPSHFNGEMIGREDSVQYLPDQKFVADEMVRASVSALVA
jgi:hypothetical protein